MVDPIPRRLSGGLGRAGFRGWRCSRPRPSSGVRTAWNTCTAVAAMLEGETGLVLVSGEAGVGKTRLTHPLRRRCPAPGGGRPVRARRGGRARPFQPFAEALDQLLQQAGAAFADEVAPALRLLSRCSEIPRRARRRLRRAIVSTGSTSSRHSSPCWSTRARRDRSCSFSTTSTGPCCRLLPAPRAPPGEGRAAAHRRSSATSTPRITRTTRIHSTRTCWGDGRGHERRAAARRAEARRPSMSTRRAHSSPTGSASPSPPSSSSASTTGRRATRCSSRRPRA